MRLTSTLPLAALLLVSAAAAKGPAPATRVLVLPAPGGTSERAVMVSEQFGTELAARGFSVMTPGDVRSLFRASGCVEGFDDIGRVRDLPFQMLKRLHDQGVGVVYGGEAGRLDGREYLHLVAIDTGRAEVIARERVRIDQRPLRNIEQRARKLRKAAGGVAGKKVFAGIGGSTGPRDNKGQWSAAVVRATGAKAARFNEVCRFPETSTRFDVVVQARLEGGHRLVVDGQDGEDERDEPLFTAARSTRGGVDRALSRMAEDVDAEISRVSLVE